MEERDVPAKLVIRVVRHQVARKQCKVEPCALRVGEDGYTREGGECEGVWCVAVQRIRLSIPQNWDSAI